MGSPSPIRLVLALPAVLVALACAGTAAKRAPAAIHGTATYRERIALPPSARVEVQLLDVTDEEAPEKRIAEQLLDAPGQVPIAFSVSYDPRAIDANRTYALRVRIRVEEDIWFASPFDVRVLTAGNPSQVEVLLERVSASLAPSSVSSRPPEPDPPDLDPRVRAARNEARAIDARLDRLDMREVAEGPEGAGGGSRRLQLWVRDEQPVKLLVSEPESGRLSAATAYYFRDGQLFWASAPYGGFLFENGALVLWVDARWKPAGDGASDEGKRREARLRDDVRLRLAAFGLE